MRYLFRTDYRQDIALSNHRGDQFWYSLLLLIMLVIPFVLGEFYIGELGGVFIFAIAGVGLMLLIGFTGLISLGHAAFLGIGAYVNSKPWSLLQTDMEIRHWPPALAGGSRPYVGSDSVSSVQDIRVILDLIRYGRLDLQPLITHRLAPQEAPAAYERVWAQDRSLVGAVIHWQ